MHIIVICYKSWYNIKGVLASMRFTRVFSSHLELSKLSFECHLQHILSSTNAMVACIACPMNWLRYEKSLVSAHHNFKWNHNKKLSINSCYPITTKPKNERSSLIRRPTRFARLPHSEVLSGALARHCSSSHTSTVRFSTPKADCRTWRFW
jgi:hypothetical protein